jgi:Xaa-Pro dipeptidase
MSDFSKRRARAADLLRSAGLGAAAFVPGPNLAYLTGVHLHLMERPTLYVLCADGSSHALMPALEQQKWRSAMPEAGTIYWEDSDGPAAGFAVLADRLGKGVLLGVEGLRMRAIEYRSLARHFGHERLVDADPALVDLRLVKDPREIDELRRAVAISEAALGETYDAGIGGQTEKQISARLKAAMLAHGATGFAFEPIVLCGGAAADPHGDASERTVAAGNVLLIDFGASYGDMHADITRTVFCEHASDAHAAIYETVLSANEAGRQAVRAGASVGDVDAAATDRLLDSPFADLILHKTGHGLGREVHEAPAVMRSNTDPQRTGMVFTIEPGLYRRNDIGVRIEDNVVVTENGHDCLTQFNREIMTLA